MLTLLSFPCFPTCALLCLLAETVSSTCFIHNTEPNTLDQPTFHSSSLALQNCSLEKAVFKTLQRNTGKRKSIHAGYTGHREGSGRLHPD